MPKPLKYSRYYLHRRLKGLCTINPRARTIDVVVGWEEEAQKAKYITQLTHSYKYTIQLSIA